MRKCAFTIFIVLYKFERKKTRYHNEFRSEISDLRTNEGRAEQCGIQKRKKRDMDVMVCNSLVPWVSPNVGRLKAMVRDHRVTIDFL